MLTEKAPSLSSTHTNIFPLNDGETMKTVALHLFPCRLDPSHKLKKVNLMIIILFNLAYYYLHFLCVPLLKLTFYTGTMKGRGNGKI